MSKKNVVWWPAVINPEHDDKYGGYDYFKYSRNSWEAWCNRNDVLFVPFEEPIEKDLHKFRVNWQKSIFVFDELERRGIEYDQIALMDSSSMIRWDTPNFFKLTERKFVGWRDMDNLKWIYDSVMGYKDFFDYELDISKYINSGCIIFNESHKDFINSFKQLYYDNREPLMEMQDKIVMKGTEQTPLNYWLQMMNIDVKTNLPLPFKLTHLHRKDLLGSNWQLKEDPTPFFIKYGYIWFFNGIPKDQRTNIMMNTWNATKDYYKESNIEFTKILDEVKHKDTAKYTTSRKFKYDLLNTFSDEKYKEMSVLELGCSQGMTTRVLSYIFNKVYAVDWDTWNLEQAKKHCAGRDNIEFSQKDVYGGTWDFPNSEVVFIDCDHVYQSVISDIENSLSNFGDPIFIFDDYGLPPGEVKRAIKDKESEGKLKIDKYIGELPENLEHAGGTKFIDVEGCICNLR